MITRSALILYIVFVSSLMLFGFVMLVKRHHLHERSRLASIAAGIARQQGWLCFVLLALAMSSASAQQPAPPSEYAIKLTAQEMAVVGAALGELPFKQSAPVIDSIQKQLKSMLEPKNPEEPKKPE